jgi:predicted oxidoreductase
MPSQVILLNQELDFPITTNQVEINLLNLDALFNGTLDQCQQHGITAQAWSPLAGSYGQASSERERRIHKELSLQAQTYGVRKWVVALCWLLKHPAQIQAILGTNNLARISEAAGALDLEYSRSDWYRLLEASTGSAVP